MMGQGRQRTRIFVKHIPQLSHGQLCTLFCLVIMQNWHIKQIDYVLAYTQAVAKTNMYMDAPKGSHSKTQMGRNPKIMFFKSKGNTMDKNKGSGSGISA